MYSVFFFFLTLLSSVPELEKCQIHQPNLVDFLLKKTYKDLPKLPRYSTYRIVLLLLLLTFYIFF